MNYQAFASQRTRLAFEAVPYNELEFIRSYWALLHEIAFSKGYPEAVSKITAIIKADLCE